MPTLHLMIGLPCSGKTTYAQELAQRTQSLLLTPDCWHLQLFGDDVGNPAHDHRHSTVEKIMWDVAQRVLSLGCNVILDFGCWAKEERDDFRERAHALGAEFQLHYMDVPTEELFRRLDNRNQSQSSTTFVIPKEEMEKYLKVFQPPTPEELLP